MTQRDSPSGPWPGYHSPSAPPSPHGPPPPTGKAPRRGETPMVLAILGLIVGIALVAYLVISGERGRWHNGSAQDSVTDDATTEPWQPGGPADPRVPARDPEAPMVADDWQVVLSPRDGMAYDVPPEWKVHEEGSNTFWPADDPEEHGSEWAYTLRDPASQAVTACDGRRIAYVGTRYIQGVSGTEEAARSVSSNLAWALYDQALEGDLTTTEAEPFENEHGVNGHIAYSTSSGAPEHGEGACASTDGRAIGVSFITSSADIVSWGLVADTGHEHAVSAETIELIVSSIRPYEG
ncbi:hypothetical protein ACFC1B_05790 [Streptomyces xiamenensis]|uniref:hypothetical protein n=1 Tax=Streptomyces xiamenensis TaxID=408015 RepID=UPI0035D95209